MSQNVGMTQTSDNSDFSVTVVRGFYETLLRGKLEAILDLLDPQVEWRAPESLPWGGVFHGHEGFREFFGRLFGQLRLQGKRVVTLMLAPAVTVVGSEAQVAKTPPP
jgi:ketosteroid isomerase-like protein